MAAVVRKSTNEENLLREVFTKSHVLIKKLMEHRHGWLFNEPVDVKGLRAACYYDIISKPMDLGTVNCRLKKGRYFNPFEFAEDVRQTFHNAIRYNKQHDAAHNMAVELLKIFELEWSKIEADFAPLFNSTERFENPFAGATSKSKKGKGKEKDSGGARDFKVSDEKYRSWRTIFLDEFLPVTEDEEGTDQPEVIDTSARSDEDEVNELKGMLASTQEKLREYEENLQNKEAKLASLESENKSLHATIEGLQRESKSSLKDFWDGFYKSMNDPTWP